MSTPSRFQHLADDLWQLSLSELRHFQGVISKIMAAKEEIAAVSENSAEERDREAAIVGSIEEAAAKKLEAEETKQRYENQLENIRQDAQSIIDEGNADKKRIISDAHTKASKEAAEIRARADREIQLAKLKALTEVKEHARELSMAIASKVIAAEIDGAKHKSIVDDVIANYGRGVSA